MQNTDNESPAQPEKRKPTFADRVRQLEEEGATTSDAQSVAEVEVDRGLVEPE